VNVREIGGGFYLLGFNNAGKLRGISRVRWLWRCFPPNRPVGCRDCEFGSGGLFDMAQFDFLGLVGFLDVAQFH